MTSQDPAPTVTAPASFFASFTGSSLTALIEALRNMASRSATPASLTVADSPAIPYTPSSSDLSSLISDLRSQALSEGNHIVAQATEYPLKAAIYARKGDLSRALPLATNLLKWRTHLNYENQDTLLTPGVRRALHQGMYVIPGTFGPDGQPVLIARCRFIDPRSYAADDVLRVFTLMIEYLHRTYPAAMSHGVIFVQDMLDYGLRNIDVSVLSSMERAFTKTVPVRMAMMGAMNPPMFVRAMYSLFTSIFSRKLQARIRVVERGNVRKMRELLTPENTPTFLELGGSLEWGDAQQAELAEKVIAAVQQWEPGTMHTEAQ